MALAALLQSTALTRLAIGGVKPDLVLLLVIVGTLLYGARVGIVWAFVGGLFLDIFSGGPMGSSSLALMAAAAIAGVGHTTLSRFNVLVPLGAIVFHAGGNRRFSNCLGIGFINANKHIESAGRPNTGLIDARTNDIFICNLFGDR